MGAMVTMKQACIITAFALLLSLLCLCISAEAAWTVAVETKPEAERDEATWCIVKPSTDEVVLDEIIEYCCTESGVNCTVINRGGACYTPSNKVSDASVVMNIYYHFNKRHPYNCYFNGSGIIIDQDPSVDACKYRAS